MNKYRYEDISLEIETKINFKLAKLSQLKANGHITEKELQYSFLTFLQNSELSTSEVFNVYTNTTIQQEVI